MTPTMGEVAGWHRELSKWFRSIANISGLTCTNELNMKRAKLWEDRAAQVEAMGWRPIEEAPKDGTLIDLWASNTKERLPDCMWGKGVWRQFQSQEEEWVDVMYGTITHFMHLPHPPVKK